MPPLQETVNRDETWRTHRTTFVYSFVIQPCPDTTAIKLKGKNGKNKFFCLHRNLFYMPA